MRTHFIWWEIRMKRVALLVPFIALSAFAEKQVIPKAIEDLQFIEKAQSLKLKGVKASSIQKLLKNNTPENWFNLHHSDDQVEGLGAEKVYAEFGEPDTEVVVAVIDSGVDVNHEDLQGKIWINSNEIPNNGIDDDGNGYVDDVFGWNFIGGKKGQAIIIQDANNLNGMTLVKGIARHQIDADTLEVTREFVRMNKLKETRRRAGSDLTLEEQTYLDNLDQTVRKEYTTAVSRVSEHQAILENFELNEKVLKIAGFDSELTYENLSKFAAGEPAVIKAKLFLMEQLQVGRNKARINRIIDFFQGNMDYYYNVDFNPRSIVGDDYFNLADRDYGNNDVIGPDSRHGTHVAGIIAANRDNYIGMKGVASNVKIMAIRCVPNGDERDKDVANSIRYAVDNGAEIINMSFGKAYSPYKKVVDDAIKYAQDKGVLLVHAAGNSSQDNNTAPNFPNRKMGTELEANNWLEIGAASWKKSATLPARFSNYGSESVDFFAPGVDVYSTTPNNEYAALSGTSMASPAAAGVAALIKSFAPNMKAAEIREIMIQASRKHPNLMVNRPGTDTKVPFHSLSIFGSSVDAYNAISNL